jgi:hypothetical protein
MKKKKEKIMRSFGSPFAITRVFIGDGAKVSWDI